MKSQKVDIFLRTLAEEIAKDPSIFKKEKRLRKGFQFSVSNLKEGKLKEKLVSNLDECFEKLQKILKQHGKGPHKEQCIKEGTEVTKVEPSTPDRTKFLYNIYNKNGMHLDEEALKKCGRSTQQAVYHVYLRCILPHLDSNTLLDIAAKCQASEKDDQFTWASQIKELCSCLHGNVNAANLKTVMKIFNAKYAEASEGITERKRLQKLITFGEQFLKVFHFHYRSLNQEFENRPKFEDYMAGILATHVDNYLELFHSDPDLLPISGKWLCSFVLGLLGKKMHYGYDVLLQLEKVKPGDGSLILPLTNYLIEFIKPKDGCSLYTKCVLTVRFITNWIPEGTEDIKQKALEFAAPADFLSWVENINPELLDDLPETKHFKGVKITHYLLNEADDNFIGCLFDLLTESYSMDGGTDEVQETEPTTATADSSDVSFFMIDKEPDMTSVEKDVFNVQSDTDEGDQIWMESPEVADDSHQAAAGEEEQNSVRFEILTHEEALKMNLIERTEIALDRVFNDNCKEEHSELAGEVDAVVQVDDKSNLFENQPNTTCEKVNDKMPDILIEIIDKDVEDGIVTTIQEEMTSPDDEDEIILIEDSSFENGTSGLRNGVCPSDHLKSPSQPLSAPADGTKTFHSPKKQKTDHIVDNRGNQKELKSSPKRKSVETVLYSPVHSSPAKQPKKRAESSAEQKDISTPTTKQTRAAEKSKNNVENSSQSSDYLMINVKTPEEQLINNKEIKLPPAGQTEQTDENRSPKYSPNKCLRSPGQRGTESIIAQDKPTSGKSWKSPVQKKHKGTDEDEKKSSSTEKDLRKKMTFCETPRLNQLKKDCELQPKKQLSAAEMARSLKEIEHNNITGSQKVAVTRRHSMSVKSTTKDDDVAFELPRTPRRAAAKALQMIAMHSPRKRRDSVSSVQSVESNSEKTEALTKGLSGDQQKESTDKCQSAVEHITATPSKRRRATMEASQLSKTLKELQSEGKTTPRKKATPVQNATPNKQALTKGLSGDQQKESTNKCQSAVEHIIATPSKRRRATMEPSQFSKTLKELQSEGKTTPRKKATPVQNATPNKRYSLRCLGKDGTDKN